MSTPGEKTLYVFTSEVEGVDENKLKVAGGLILYAYSCCK
jgi:hypothetical protein